MTGNYLWIASLMFIGSWLLYWRKKRKFDRLNEHGIEVFVSYSEKVKNNSFDTMLLWAGYASFISGVLMLMTIDYTAVGWLVFSIMVILLIRKSCNRRK